MKQKRILLIRPDRVGDVILTTPLIKGIKETFPDCHLTLMINPKTKPLLENNPNIDKIILDDSEGDNKGRKEFWNQVRLLRKENFTTGLMPLPRERHAWMMFFALIPERIGVGKILYEILTGMKTVPKTYIPLRHEADYIYDLGRKIGVIDIPLIPELFLSEKEKQSAKLQLQEIGIDISKPIIGLNPISGGSVPNWTLKNYIELAKRLNESNQVLFILPNANPQLQNELANKKNIFYISPNLKELVAICNQLSVLFSSSTGTSHIASALKIKTITLYCPLNTCSATHWGTLGNETINHIATDKYCHIQCSGNPKTCTLDEIQLDDVVASIISSLK